MGIHDLQKFLECDNLEGGAVSVDLIKIARNVTQRQQPHNTNRKIRPIGNKLKLIVDAENCLDRLYGGYFSDWACGGQWNRMLQFLSLLTHAIERGNIELAVVFNGTIEPCRMNEWLAEQANVRQRVGMVLKHINTKATPPPKIWWTPPTCLRGALRMALRHLGVTVMCTMDDHHQEVIAYCREYGFHGLLADDAEYAAFDPPRYFSSENIKLTYKGSIETKEFMVSELTKTLQITQEQVCIMAALLGNFLLPESDLQDFYKRINIKNSDNSFESNIKLLAEFVKTLPPPSNMDALVAAVFGSATDKRAAKLQQSVQYYLNGTANGFLKYCAPATNPKEKKNNNNNGALNNDNVKVDDHDLDTSGFASETTEQERETLQSYKLATANTIVTDLEGLEANDIKNSETSHFNGISNGSIPAASSKGPSNSSAASSSSVASTSGSATSASNSKVNILSSTTTSSNADSNSTPSSPKTNSTYNNNKSVSSNLVTPSVSTDVMRTASLRHQKGLMAPTILHVLSTQEVRLPCLMEDEGNREFPPIHDIYKPLRKRVYAVLFNLHHLRYVHAKKKETKEIPENAPQPEIIVKEWIYSRSNPYQYPVEVKAEPLPWAVPTLQRLWFGPSVDDKRRRMRALLSCLNSDTPLILNTSYVPQHMLIMACVLRYIMSQDKPIMRRQELDAFICHAFNPNLMNPQYLQELTLNVVTSRGVQLAALFMKGVDMALLANDACGAPLPWLMCCPWLYFDGKLFHHTLTRSASAKNLLELCENFIERVVKVERMRKAILEGLDVQFAKPPLLPFTGGMVRQGMPPPHCLPPMSLPSNRGAAALRQRPIPSRGGQLQIAGVVVGQWGANYGYPNNTQRYQLMQANTPGMSSYKQGSNTVVSGSGVGRRGGMNNSNAFNYNGGGGARGRNNYHHQQPQQHHQQQQQQQQQQQRKVSYNVANTRKNTAHKKRNTNKNNKNQSTRGPPLIVKTDKGDIPASEVNLKENTATDGDECSAANAPATSSTVAAAAGGGESAPPQQHHLGQGDAPTTATTNN